MLNKVIKIDPNAPFVVGHMAIAYSHNEIENTMVVWGKSKVVDTDRDAQLIVKQWKQQLGFNDKVKYGTVPVYITAPQT